MTIEALEVMPRQPFGKNLLSRISVYLIWIPGPGHVRPACTALLSRRILQHLSIKIAVLGVALILCAAITACKKSTQVSPLSSTQAQGRPDQDSRKHERLPSLDQVMKLPLTDWVVEKERSVGVGPAVLLLVENHSSLAGQVEEALLLNQLMMEFGATDVVLEGTAEEGLAANVYTGLSESRRREFALSQLRDGEISGVEFAKLMYKDIALHSGETPRSSKNFGLDESEQLETYFVTKEFLSLIAINESPSADSHLKKLLAERERFEMASHVRSNPERAASSFKKYIGFLDREIQRGSWAKKADGILNGTSSDDPISLEDEIATIEAVEKRMTEVGISAKSNGLLNRQKAYLQDRVEASRAVVSSVRALRSSADTRIIVAVVGTAHASGITQNLRADRVPFVVLEPLSLKQGGQLTYNQFEMKLSNRSIWEDTAVSKFLYPIGGQHKPPSAIGTDWFERKSELFDLTDDYGEYLLSAGTDRIGTGIQTSEFARQHFRISSAARNPATLQEQAGELRHVTFSVETEEKGGHDLALWVKVVGLRDEEISRQMASDSTRNRLEAVLKELRDDARATKEERQREALARKGAVVIRTGPRLLIYASSEADLNRLRDADYL